MKDPNQLHLVNDLTGRIKVMTINNEPSKTQQQFKDECDINNIIKKFQNTGEFTHRAKNPGMYGDFSNITDYQGMLHTIQQAQDSFMTLPALTRKKFDNDPGELIKFLKDPSNTEEAIKLGLVEPKQQQTQQTQTPSQTQTSKQPKKAQTPAISTPDSE